jgi:hypothetical protein
MAVSFKGAHFPIINRWVIKYGPQLEIYQSCNLHKTLC